MKKKHFNEKKVLISILLFSIIILMLPNIIRYYVVGNVLIGDFSYYHARISEEISTGRIPTHDDLSYDGRLYIFNPYHFFLAFFLYVFNNEFALKLVPLILGTLTTLLFYVILKKFGTNQQVRGLSSLIFMLSPVYLYTFVSPNPTNLVVFLQLLGIYLFMQRKIYFFVLSTIIFAFIPLFGFFHVFVIFLLLLSYSIYKKRFRRFSIVLIILALISSYYYNFLLNLPNEKILFLTKNIFGNIIAGLGAVSGISIFVILLALVGIVALWGYKKKLHPVQSIIFLALLLVFIYTAPLLNIYFALFLSLFAALGFNMLIEMKWEIKTIKNLTLIILAFGLLFSSTSYILRISNFEPSLQSIVSLEWLRENYSSGTVFSYYSKGFWIEHVAGFPTFMDSFFDYAPSPNKRFNISDVIFHSQDLRKTTALLQKNEIKYIWIDKKMKEGQVWKEPDKGLLFLFKNNETFKKIYSAPSTIIYEVIS